MAINILAPTKPLPLSYLLIYSCQFYIFFFLPLGKNVGLKGLNQVSRFDVRQLPSYSWHQILDSMSFLYIFCLQYTRMVLVNTFIQLFATWFPDVERSIRFRFVSPTFNPWEYMFAWFVHVFYLSKSIKYVEINHPLIMKLFYRYFALAVWKAIRQWT